MKNPYLPYPVTIEKITEETQDKSLRTFRLVFQNKEDEAAFAYKPLAEILENIADTVHVIKQIKPIYNFKAAE